MGATTQVGDEEGNPSRRISEDELFDVLSNHRRRYVVHVLKREDGDVEIGSLADRVAAWENEETVPEVGHHERKRVYTALQQQHLPRMDKAGVVEFDKDRGTVEPTPALEEVDLYLDVVRGKEVPWSEYYLTISAVTVALVAGVGLDLPPFGLLPEFGWLLFVVVVFTCSALAHRYYVTELGADEVPPELDR